MLHASERWTQAYDPFDSLWLSAGVAVLPILIFFTALAVFRLKGHVAATLTTASALLVAIAAYGMPVSTALAAAIYGVAYGLWPIAWIVVAAVFLYCVAQHTGQFAIIRISIFRLTDDQRLQLLVVGFAFGAFLEGAAGFGAPVAITAALLAGLGFRPLHAAGLCLVANTAPVAFGAMGIPIIVAGKLTQLDPFVVGQMAGRQLPFMSLLIPPWLIFTFDGVRGLRDTWPALIVAGVTFGGAQYLTANLIGPELPDITAGLTTLGALAIFLRYWQPKSVAAIPTVPPSSAAVGPSWWGWMPFLLLTILVTLWSLPVVRAMLAPGGALAFATVSLAMPGLDHAVTKVAPIAASPTAVEAVWKIDWIGATGTAIAFAGIVSLLLAHVSLRSAGAIASTTLAELRRPIYTISMVLAFAMIANFSGMVGTLALLFAKAGPLFPAVAPALGWLGVFLTGSDTSSNALFVGVQAATAHQIGVSDVLLVASNTTGGVTGKMISPQSIAIACAAVGLVGQEAALFRFALRHSLLMLGAIGALTLAQAYWLTWMIP